MKSISLETLAKQIGVGVATVDRVLNERGGVSPATTRKVLQAAREAGLRRILPEEHRFPWQIEVFLSANDSFFFQQLAQDFAHVADVLGYRRLTLHRTFVPESRPEKLAQLIVNGSKKRHALIVFGNEHPVIYDALERCRERNIPVITLATDLPGAARLCHVGINQLQAGRTAGMMMGRMVQRTGEVLILSGRTDYSAHRLRIQGFREVLAQHFPQLQLREPLAGQEDRATITRLLEKSLSQNGNLAGIYNTGLGNTQVGEALARHRRYGECCWITHERYATTREQLAKGGLALTLDQNTRQHAQLAIDLMLRHLEQGIQPPTYADGKVDFILYTSENVE
ncbi:LacI family DNA-binding transcriptional regulator [Serratia inhibens]|uniref:LacI family transcriptional regulator n=1 Tax=Serratia inhibens TaxID=2338073 RepID=A0AA93BWE7_9GAMM|nr:LacI family DNA-binding transcriptional regulator [Serratia inhibens]ANS43685.1 D-ribose-binding periplasmic protein [Serratia inhibens PRI-2C]RJF56031.1 LacI family transcriptional regulator [Serratia inhibens]